MKIVKGIPSNKRADITEWAFPYFKHVVNLSLFFSIILEETDWNLSAMLVDDEGIVKGAYLLGKGSPAYLMDAGQWGKYQNLKGVEGVMLTVDESIRGQGWGNKLKDYPKTLGVDYIWGQQLKGLNNLEDWLKRRELVGETDDCYITLEKY